MHGAARLGLEGWVGTGPVWTFVWVRGFKASPGRLGWILGWKVGSGLGPGLEGYVRPGPYLAQA